MNNKTVVRVLLLAVVVAGIVLGILNRESFNKETVETWIMAAGVWGPVLFIAIYSAATVFFLPGSVLTIAGGALFGPVLGAAYNIIGATTGATLAFLVARYLASEWVARRSGKMAKKLSKCVEDEGWRVVAFTRLVPVFPFTLLNYSFGLTKVRLLHYILASLVFMLPGTFAFTYVGYAAEQAVGGADGVLSTALWALGLLAVISYMPRLVKQLRSTDLNQAKTESTAEEAAPATA